MGISGKHVLKSFGEFKDIKVRYVPFPRIRRPVRSRVLARWFDIWLRGC